MRATRGLPYNPSRDSARQGTFYTLGVYSMHAREEESVNEAQCVYIDSLDRKCIGKYVCVSSRAVKNGRD